MKYIFILFLLPAVIFSQVTNIKDLKLNDSNGIPVNIGKTYSITGVVTASDNLGFAGPGSIQDSTGAISVYGSGFTQNVSIGDSVTLSGNLTHFNGLTQLSFDNASSILEIHKSNAFIDTLIITIDQIKSQMWNGYEEFESKLVRINNVKIEGSGSFGSNTNYNISDNTGMLVDGLRIDKDVVSLVGSPVPDNNVDIIGIIGQYKYSAPYNEGYQILPRSFEDLISDGAPLIYSSVFVSKIDSTSFTVNFKTVKEGNTIIKYGLTQSLELDSLKIDSLSIEHQITINKLKPLTKYYYQVYSENNYGISKSDILTIITRAEDPVTGEINVYFNFDVDTTVAIPGNNALGNVYFPEKLIQRINSAEYSIDLALYSFFGMDDVADAIIAARDRGVKVRVVYHNRTPYQSSMQLLYDAGINIQKRKDNDGLMHNKFFIFDGRDEDLTNDWIWTGSWNVTSLELNWKNNVIEINDPTLAAAYQTEFEEMWGSNTDTQNSSNARFGFNKYDNTAHTFQINNKLVELYFSPSDATEDKIINTIQSMDYSIYFATLSFTSDDIYNSIRNSHLISSKDIRGIIDNTSDNGSEFSNLLNISSEIFDYDLSETLHHKYGMIDASISNSDPVIITGSHNWSRSANEKNDENTLIIHDMLIVNQYMQEFKKRYNELGGVLAFSIPVTVVDDHNLQIPSDAELYQNYPNPFNPITTISFFLLEKMDIELAVYNTLGEKVKSIYNGLANEGKNFFDFKAEDLSSGIYFYQLKTDNFSLVKKLLILK